MSLEIKPAKEAAFDQVSLGEVERLMGGGGARVVR
jgi:hypothetical protein